MAQKPELEILPFTSHACWEDWLAENHASSPGLWVKFAKKGSDIETVTYAEALEEALCYGWIDGQTKSFDERYWLQRFTPRRPRSKWSQVNREKVDALIAAGRMKPAGLLEAERAKADGRWEAAYEPPSKVTVPEDLRRELDAHPDAATFFADLDGRNRYAILYGLQDAKKSETRARRLQKFVTMLNERRKPYP
jgi:uncharacterized protein YdeI (YjbR/CyaY-like superfamily)